MAVTAAPAHDVPRMLATPTVNGLWRHLKLAAVFVTIANERPKVIDKLGCSVVPHMRRTGQRFVVDSPARCDRPGQTRSGRPSSSAEICVDSRDIGWAVVRGELRPCQIAAADSDVHRFYQWLRTGRLAVDTHHLGLLHCLVQVITLNSVALGGEDHGRVPAGAPKNVQHIKPIERVLDCVVIPGKVGDHHVKPQTVAHRALHRRLVLSDPYRRVTHGLLQKGLNDLSQCSSNQDTWAVRHRLPPNWHRWLIIERPGAGARARRRAPPRPPAPSRRRRRPRRGCWARWPGPRRAGTPPA